MKHSTSIPIVVFLLLLVGMASCSQEKKTHETDEMAAYLLVYFTDPTHSLFMALSTDGYTFTDINNGQPIAAGDTLASQKGVRDPHISRGPDGAFYMVMTLPLVDTQIFY
ncbi:hypothetical protein [Reichenbachiella ulvae]|uniref:Uncharacterized protein n=1 Tax=Reichenbachiella ulvae TaxID=2980104 RepID=A0ABT3CUJ4_9BACT|nr:hypothetical protein [Reichenbachiella ulvae]MCV9387356.1 hypothetical protein [Reichenbachiella ulvae]